MSKWYEVLMYIGQAVLLWMVIIMLFAGGPIMVDMFDAKTVQLKEETTYWQDAALTCPTWPAAEVNR